MHPFASYVLRTYYKATGWNEDNLYANLTRSSNGTIVIFYVLQDLTVVFQPFWISPFLGDFIFQYPSPQILYSRQRIQWQRCRLLTDPWATYLHPVI